MNESKLLDSLKTMNWTPIARTHGNDHSTLVGFLVQWWISRDPAVHWALDSGPTHAATQDGAVEASATPCSAGTLTQWACLRSRVRGTTRQYRKSGNSFVLPELTWRLSSLRSFSYIPLVPAVTVLNDNSPRRSVLQSKSASAQYPRQVQRESFWCWNF